jgi:DNA invertase Pin-like site-specific DNA recombinase
MNERAARWIRVSSGSQDEALQVPDIDQHCRAHSYDVVKTYTLHDKSASKGEHEPALADMLADMAAGQFSVLVCWQSSRLDRQGTKRGYAILTAVELAGGRIEVTQEPEFGGDGFGDEIMTTVRMVTNRAESRTKSERVRAAMDRVAANGALWGRTPWGFTSAGPKYARRLVPTDEAREYVPQIYARVIGGQSLAQVCRWLESEHVAPMGIASDRSTRGKRGQWWPRSLGQLIRNPVYMGLRVDGDGQTVCELDDEDVLVDAATWAAAGKRLDKKQRRGPVLKSNRCALSGASRCHACGGPLYKIRSQYGQHGPGHYLRCAGTGPDRRSCGAPMIWLETAEALAEQVMGGLLHPVYEITVVPGNGAELDAALARLDYERRQVALRGLSWADEDAERARIRAAYDLVTATERIPDRRAVTDTGVTYGQRWAKLDVNGRAEWLRSGEFTIVFARDEVDGATAVRDGVSIVLHWAEESDDEAAA